MPIEMAGALRLGPRAAGGSSAPSTLVAYLESIGKASWYSIFEVGTGMFQNSNGTGSVASGDPVGCWVAANQVGATFKFHQPTSGSRPTYSTSQYALPTIYGNASSHTLFTDSTTALNRELTVMVQCFTGNGGNYTWAQNGAVWGLLGVANSPHSQLENGTSVFGQGFTTVDDVVCSVTSRYRAGSSSGHGRRAVAFNSSEPIRTSRYNNALYLLSDRGLGSFSAHGIRRIAIINPRLTFMEQSYALSFWGT